MFKDLATNERNFNVASILFGLLTTLIGGWHVTLQVLLILMLVDLGSGIFKALYKKELGGFSSRKFREGLIHKASYILVLILAYQLDTLVGTGDTTIRNIICLFYIAVEGTSLIENLGQIGVPIPKFIAKRLTVLRDTISDTGTIDVPQD